MERPNSHSILYEKHKIVSGIISVVICIAVTLTFAWVILKPNRSVGIPLKSFEPTNELKVTLRIDDLIPFHSFLDIYMVPTLTNVSLGSTHVESLVYLLDGTVVMGKRNDFSIKCDDNICEKVLVASITPIREQTFIIEGTITSENPISDVILIAEYNSYSWVLSMNIIHLLAMVLNSIGIITLLFLWRKTPMREWYFEHSYLLVLLFFSILYDATYPFLYLYENVYVLWALQGLESLFIFILFLYYLIVLICMSSKYSPNKGSILLGIGVGIGQFCCMVALLMYNGSVNIKNYTKLDPPVESYVLISALTFTDILYIFLCCYQTYCVLKNNKSFKQFVVHFLFSVPVGVILVLTTYNYYYTTLVPAVSFKLTTTFSSQILLIGLYLLTFGTYSPSQSDVEYKLVDDEIPLDDETISHDRKSLDLSVRPQLPNTTNAQIPTGRLQPNSIQRIDVEKEESAPQPNLINENEIIL